MLRNSLPAALVTLGWSCSCLSVLCERKSAVHCKKYLVKMTISEWLLQFQGSLNRWVIWLQEFQNTIIIHQPPHNSIKLQRVTTDTCQQVYLWKFIGNYPVQNWIIASRWMHTNWYLLVSRKVSLQAWWIVRGMIVFDFSNYLFNWPWNCTNLHSWSF